MIIHKITGQSLRKFLLFFICFIITWFISRLFNLHLNKLELFFQNIKFSISQNLIHYQKISDKVLLILIDKKSSDYLKIPIEGNAWREYDIQIINTLLQNNASVIGVDIDYSLKPTQWDRHLTETINKSGKVICVKINSNTDQNDMIKNIDNIGSALITTYQGVPRKIDQYPVHSSLKAFSYTIAFKYLQTIQAPNFMEQRKKELLINKISNLKEFWINYKFPADYFPVFSYIDVIQAENGRVHNSDRTPLSIFKNRIIIIAKDLEKFPLPTDLNKKIFSALIQAYAVENLCSENYLKIVPDPFQEIFLLMFHLSMMILFLSFKKYYKYFLGWMTFLIFFVIQMILFERMNIEFNLSSFYISTLLWSITVFSYDKWSLSKNTWSIRNKIIKLEELNHKFEKLDQFKDNLSETIVHDIKNVISTIEMSLAYLSLKYKDDPKTYRNIHSAIDACSSIIHLSSNLIDIRAIEDDRAVFTSESCDFTYLESVIHKIQSYYLSIPKNITFELISPETEFIVNADKSYIEHVFHNLINNAYKYTPDGGMIKITFINTENTGQVSFFNSGIPFPEEQKRIIFDKYTQLGASRSKYSKGLGLYYCKLVLNAMNADILVETDDAGNRFIIQFRKKYI